MSGKVEEWRPGGGVPGVGARATLDRSRAGVDRVAEDPPAGLRDLLARLSAQQEEIARARPLPEPTLRSLLDDFLIRYAHETTAIEGNTLTLHETQVVLEHGITIGGKTLREHLEVVNIRGAWEWLQDAVRNRAAVAEETILHLHRLVTQGILGPEAGRYRTVPVYIRNSLHVPPNPVHVPERMAEFIGRFRERRADEHPVCHAALAHIELAGIHPFVDGNGRVARMLVNLLLLRDAYPPALYTMTNRAEYLRTLELAQFRGETEPFVRVTAEATRFMVERYVHAIEQTRQAEAQGVAPTPPRDQDRDPGR